MEAGVAGALVLVGCSGGSSRHSAGSEDGTPSRFPVIVTQKVAPVTIEEEPRRVVALDLPSADAAIALGAVPVGMAELSYLEGGMQEWTKAALGDARR